MEGLSGPEPIMAGMKRLPVAFDTQNSLPRPKKGANRVPSQVGLTKV